MIIDTSALIAILLGEPDAMKYASVIETAQERRISAANFFEASIVIDNVRDPVVSRRFDEFIAAAEIEVVSVTVRQAWIARDAYRDFGKGNGHPAKLNYGDCFSYALAKDLDEPLLFKGNDFIHTDLRSAIAD